MKSRGSTPLLSCKSTRIDLLVTYVWELAFALEDLRESVSRSRIADIYHTVDPLSKVRFGCKMLIVDSGFGLICLKLSILLYPNNVLRTSVAAGCRTLITTIKDAQTASEGLRMVAASFTADHQVSLKRENSGSRVSAHHTILYLVVK